MAHVAPDRLNQQSQDPMDDSPDGHESVSMFSKVKNKAKKIRDKVKSQYRGDDKEKEEEDDEEIEDDDDKVVEKPDHNVEGVTNSMAGLGGLGAAKKDDRSKQESENVNKPTFGDILGSDEQKPVKAKESPKENTSYFNETEQGGGNDRWKQESENVNKTRLGDILGSEEQKPIKAKEDTSYFDETEQGGWDTSYFNETEQGGGKRDDPIFDAEKEKTETDAGIPSIPQKAGMAMAGAGATGRILGVVKGNKREGGGEEKPNSSEFDEPPPALKEVPKPLEEEFQSLLGKSKDQQGDVGEGNELSSDKKQIEEAKSDPSEVPKKASGLFQGLRDSFSSDQGKKNDVVPEDQSRGNQDEGKQSEEEKGGQGYAQKLFAAKNVITSKLGYGGPPNDQQTDVGEGKSLSSDEKPTSGIGFVEDLKTSDEVNKKDDNLPEEQSRESQETGSEDKEGEGYGQKLSVAKNAISSKLGYGQQTDVGEGKDLSSNEKPTSGIGFVEDLKTSDEVNKKDDNLPEEQSRGNQETGSEDKEGQGYGQQLSVAKNAISSKLGYGGLPNEEKAAVEESISENKEKDSVADESKGEKENLQSLKTEEGTENKQNFKSTIASKLSPGEDDKALSEKITEAFNNSAKSILGGFYGGSPKAQGPKTEVPPSPTGNQGASELPQNNNPQNSAAPQGIVGRVTGVVSSFIGKKPKEGVDNSSPKAQDPPPYGEHEEKPTGSSETQIGNQIEEPTK